MSNAVSVLDKKLPAHLRVLASDAADTVDEWSSGTATGFPVISINGKVFHIKRGDDLELVCRDDDPDEPASKLQIVVLRSNRGVSRTYYADKYVEGSDDAPDCYSDDGITPNADAEDRQAKKCATCPNAQWGSRITENGKKGKACSEVKRLAVVPAGLLNDPMLLRLPPTSLKGWDKYIDSISKRGLNPTQVITQISFDPSVSHQLMLFKPVGFVTADMVAEVEEVLADPMLELIIGAGNSGADESAGVDEEDEAPAPKPKAKRKPRAKPAPVVEDDEEEEVEEEAAPPPKRKRKPRAKPAPVVEDDDYEVDEDEVEEEEPAPKPKAKRKPRAKAKPVVEPEEEEDDGLDGLEGLDFDDIDFGDED